MNFLSHELIERLKWTSQALDMADTPSEEEFSTLLREMPAFDFGQVTLNLKRPWLALHLGRKAGRLILMKRLTRLTEHQLAIALSTYGAVLSDWSDKTLGNIQRRFEAYANTLRAQAQRAMETQELPVGHEEKMRRDLEALE